MCFLYGAGCDSTKAHETQTKIHTNTEFYNLSFFPLFFFDWKIADNKRWEQPIKKKHKHTHDETKIFARYYDYYLLSYLLVSSRWFRRCLVLFILFWFGCRFIVWSIQDKAMTISILTKYSKAHETMTRWWKWRQRYGIIVSEKCFTHKHTHTWHLKKTTFFTILAPQHTICIYFILLSSLECTLIVRFHNKFFFSFLFFVYFEFRSKFTLPERKNLN